MLRIVPLLALFLGLANSALAADMQRNVLLLISDNQSWPDLGCLGNQEVQTPHLDGLAADGTLFVNAFVPTASCSPSRGVIYTGLHGHDNGQYGLQHGLHNFQQRPHVQSIFMLLAAAGYRTAMIGKKNVGPDALYPIDFEPKVGLRDSIALAAAAGEFFRAGDEPFFAAVGFHDPHPVGRADAAMEWGITEEDSRLPIPHYDPAEVTVPGYLPDAPEVREGIAGYYRQITRMDAGVGGVLKELQNAGKAADTLVLFLSDHGTSEPGAMANHYDPGLRVPMIIRNPLQEQRGVKSQAMVSSVDLVPTIVEWTGVQGPRYKLHGRSLLSILGEENPPGWDEIYASHTFHEVTMYYPMRTVRTRRYKYIWNIAWRLGFTNPIDTQHRRTWMNAVARGEGMIGPRRIEDFLWRDEVELYDLAADPLELHNLADDPAYAKVRADLAAKVKRFQEETSDPWIVRYEY